MSLENLKAAEDKLAQIVKRYPNKRSALMPALYLGQEAVGYVSAEVISWVATKIGVSSAEVKEVATFYTMYQQKPVGKYHLQVCRTLSCHLAGAKPLVNFLKEKLAVDAHQVTADGLFSYEEVECLGSCGTGPVVQINDVYFERMDSEKLASLLERIKTELPDLRYSTLKDELGVGLADMPRSQLVNLKEGKHGAS
ncbi:MAG: NAD(P)H-dependent oxidoreductase subunit E [Deltaproteobacteria bacterium]|nr:NAD(P)H-dependent oxidoreductase subunit E [Deltaproteobacteria bacterium]